MFYVFFYIVNFQTIGSVRIPLYIMELMLKLIVFKAMHFTPSVLTSFSGKFIDLRPYHNTLGFLVELQEIFSKY